MTEAWPWLLVGARLLPSAVGLALVVSGPLLWGAAGWLACLLPLAVPAADVGQGASAMALLVELAVGVAFALALCAPLWAARHGGQLLEQAFGGAWGPGPGALSRLFGWLTLALFASLGGLRLWSESLLTAAAGAGSSPSFAGQAARVGALVGQLLRLSVTVAAPAWIAFVLLDLLLALLNRLSGGPGRAIVGLAMPLRLGSLVVAVPLLAERFPEWWRLSAREALQVLEHLTH